VSWDQRSETDAKYRTPEHRRERKKYAEQMKREGRLTCAQPECVMASRVIAPDDVWHVGHDESGEHYIGPVHRDCNLRDAAVRARAKQNEPQRRWVL
jgi:hypothetical protein